MATQVTEFFEPQGATRDAQVPTTRRVLPAMLRGARLTCPSCGEGRLYRAYLKVNDACPACGEALHHQRADDAPPYVTIFVVGHIIVAAVIGIDTAYAWPMWLHALVWTPLTVGLSLGLLPIVKGALVGLQWSLGMHGFGSGDKAATSTVPEAMPYTHCVAG